MERSVIFAGFGGQGLLFCGHVLAEAAVDEGRQVSWMPSYGPEMRGGTASCTVIVADGPIGSPLVDEADCVVVLNPPSLARYGGSVRPGGLLVVNTSLIEAWPERDDIEILALSCSGLAGEAGDAALAGVVALGGLIARRPLVRPGSVEMALRRLVPAERHDLLLADLRALRSGLAAAGQRLPAQPADEPPEQSPEGSPEQPRAAPP